MILKSITLRENPQFNRRTLDSAPRADAFNYRTLGSEPLRYSAHLRTHTAPETETTHFTTILSICDIRIFAI